MEEWVALNVAAARVLADVRKRREEEGRSAERPAGATRENVVGGIGASAITPTPASNQDRPRLAVLPQPDGARPR